MSPSDSVLDRDVRPWAERWPHPVRFDASEGYAGAGVLGCRTGPADSLAFENLAHELAHAFEALDTKGPKALGLPHWGLRIKTRLQIGSQTFFEPVTFQPTERECRVVGIQRRLLEMAGHPAADGLFDYFARVLTSFMPDWTHGGSTTEARWATRRALMEAAHGAWPEDRVRSQWPTVAAGLEQAWQAGLQASAGPRARRPRP